ncbi:MAG: hypothetical protein ACRDIY_12245, partial [Chloroflexota bacterium]
ARQMVERMLRERLDRATVSLANRLLDGVPAGQLPSGAQIARLRAVTRDGLGRPDADARSGLLEFLRHAEERQAARRQLQRALVGGQPLADWLRAQIQNPRSTWDALLDQDQRARLPSIGAIRASYREDLAIGYALRLIDGVLAGMAKARLPDGEG